VLAEIIAIGDEICRGEITDTNSAWLAEQLWSLDVTVSWISSCRDIADDIYDAVDRAVNRTAVVVVSGGLGPTEDDLTVDVISRSAGVEPVIDAESLQRMEQRFAQTGYRLTSNSRRQVRVPKGSRVFINQIGLAPGFEVTVGGVPVICLPGVPRELKSLFTGQISSRLVSLRESSGAPAERIARRVLRVFGMGESQIATAIGDAAAGVPGASLHYQVSFPETLVKVVVRDTDREAADRRLAEIEQRVRARLGDKLYGQDDDTLAAVVGRRLAVLGATLATAESCTGGLVGALITEVAGASSYYRGGAVVYDNAEKVRQLGVEEATLGAHGAVSRECVVEMAQGACRRFAVDYAVAVSGIAGPGGGTADKPVGTVWIAVAGPDRTDSRHYVWPGSRDQIRSLAAHAALAMVLRLADSSRTP
jgi:nicotinamide-nucleotide amidase